MISLVTGIGCVVIAVLLAFGVIHRCEAKDRGHPIEFREFRR